MNVLMDYFDKIDKKNKLAHSFLIGNTSYKEIEGDIKRILEKHIFEKDIDVNNNPDIYVLTNEDGQVSKEKVKQLISNISKTSQFNNNKVYIIDECEKLNDFAYNAILKTLEEPPENTYAFLITKNMDSVKSTIQSRCQKIFVSTNSEEVIDEKYVEIGNKLYNLINNSDSDILYKNSEIYNEIDNRETLYYVLKYLQQQYFKDLNASIDDKSKKSDIMGIARKIVIINENINRLKYYLNKNISLDRFLIDIWRCKI